MEDSKIKAKVVEGMHGDGFYCPRAVSIDVAATFGIATHARGRAKSLIEDLANDAASPVRYKVVGESVCLDAEASEVAAFIREHGGEDAVPWDLASEL